MRIQKFPESVNFDKTVLWQYSNAERLKKLVGLFNSMFEYCAVRPWRLLTKSLTLGKSTELDTWNNYALRNDRANGGAAIQFRPSSIGMKSGDALSYITVVTTDTRKGPNAFDQGTFRIKIKNDRDSSEYIAVSEPIAIPKAYTLPANVFPIVGEYSGGPSYSVGGNSGLIFNERSSTIDVVFTLVPNKTLFTCDARTLAYKEAGSEVSSITFGGAEPVSGSFPVLSRRDGGYNYPAKFTIVGREVELDPDRLYYIVFERQSEATGTWSEHTFGVSLYVNNAQSSEGLCYVKSSPLVTWQPITEFGWIDAELRAAEERTLMLISTMFGIQNPGYYPGQPGSISLKTWGRYIQSQIYLMDCNGSVKDLNDWIKAVLPNATCRITDNRDMTISYDFIDNLSSDDENLIHAPGFFHAPAGVLIGTPTQALDVKFGLVQSPSQTKVANIGALNEGRFANSPDEAVYTPVSQQ